MGGAKSLCVVIGWFSSWTLSSDWSSLASRWVNQPCGKKTWAKKKTEWHLYYRRTEEMRFDWATAPERAFLLVHPPKRCRDDSRYWAPSNQGYSIVHRAVRVGGESRRENTEMWLVGIKELTSVSELEEKFPFICFSMPGLAEPLKEGEVLIGQSFGSSRDWSKAILLKTKLTPVSFDV